MNLNGDLVRERLTRVASVLRDEQVGRLDAVWFLGFLLGRYWRRAAGVPLDVVGEVPRAVVDAIGVTAEHIVSEVYGDAPPAPTLPPHA